MKRAVGVGLALGVALLAAGCGPATPHSDDLNQPPQSDAPASLAPAADIRAMVPLSIKDDGVLRVGVVPLQEPASFLEDGEIVGYSVELAAGIATLMGLDLKIVRTDLPNLMTELGSEYDIAISSIPVTPENLQQANLVTYMNVASQLVVARSPQEPLKAGFPCGADIQALENTIQVGQLGEMSADCESKGLDPIKISTVDSQRVMVNNIIRSRAAGALMDATAAEYSIDQSLGRLKSRDDPVNPLAQGVAVSPENEQLTVAVQAAVQKLLDEGFINTILESYDLTNVGVSQSIINPRVG